MIYCVRYYQVWFNFSQGIQWCKGGSNQEEKKNVQFSDYFQVKLICKFNFSILGIIAIVLQAIIESHKLIEKPWQQFSIFQFDFSILRIIAIVRHKLRNLGNNFLIVFPCWKVSCYKADIVSKVLLQVRGLCQQMVKGGFIIMDTLTILQKFIYKPCGF